MERKLFLKNGLAALGLATIVPLVNACTANSADSVFKDSLDNELATVTGSVSAGYTLTHTIYVAA